ncbi:MAG: DUF4349 domain-containing protein [Erythrobacter sp.]
MSALALAGCGAESDYAAEEGDVSYSMDVDAAEAPAEEVAGAVAETTESGDAAPETLEVSEPQIAYRYSLGFRLPADAIKPLQEKHADLCEAKGPKVCRIIAMDQSDEDGDYASGNLQLAVAADKARAFSKEIESSSGEADGELTSSSIEGEDLSKAIVDTEAKLRARTLLRDRLMEVLRSRNGTVAELVEAERGVAQVNQEIDQARSWLTEMRGRVAYSQMIIEYASGSPSSGGFTDPIRSAWGSLGGIFGGLIAFLIVAGAVFIPLGLIGWLIWRLVATVRRKSQGPQTDVAMAETVAEPNET